MFARAIDEEPIVGAAFSKRNNKIMIRFGLQHRAGDGSLAWLREVDRAQCPCVVDTRKS